MVTKRFEKVIDKVGKLPAEEQDALADWIIEEFRVAFARLPKNIQRQARKAYRKFEDSPDYPGLHFRKIHTRREIYSVRISQSYRALGIIQDDEIIWFW